MIAAISVAACVAYLAGGARGIGVSERDRVFSPADREEIQLLLSARDVPIDNRPSFSNLAGRLSLGVARGRRSALRDLAAVATALAIAAFGAWLLTLRVRMFIVAMTLVCMSMSPLFWGRGIAWTFDALTPALGLLALWATSRWFATRRRLFAAIAIAAAIGAFTDWRLGVLDSSPQQLAIASLAEFTALGAFVAVIGLLVLLDPRSPRLLFAFGWAAVAMLSEFGRHSTFDAVPLTLAIGGWTAFALGLESIQKRVSRSAGIALVSVVALVVTAAPVLTRARLWALGRDLPSEVRTRLAADIRAADLPDHVAFIAEAHRADVMLRLGLKQARREAAFVPQAADKVLAAANQSLTVLAFDHARANLERFGFLFERHWIGNTEVSTVAGHTPCLELKPGEWQDVSLLTGTGSFIIHGSRPGTAPGGVVVRVKGSAAPQVTTIEPRSIPFEVIGTDVRVPETGRADPVIVTLASAPISTTAAAQEGSPVRICAGVHRGPSTLGRAATASASLPMNDAALFGDGWHPLEADPDFFRWTAAPEALVRVRVASPSDMRITLTATPAARPSQRPTIGVVVNGCRSAVRQMQQGQGDYEWIVVASCWRAGLNHVWIAVTPLISPASFYKTHDTRLLGARIGAIRLARQ